MKKILVTEIEIPSCHHIRYIWFDLPAVPERGFYIAVTSYNAFFYGRKKRNHSKNRLFVAHRPDEIFSNTMTAGIPEQSVKDLWEFYRLIGYDHRNNRYTLSSSATVCEASV